MAGMAAEPIGVSIRGDSVRLGQFLKLADAVDQGSDAKALLGRGGVTVNGEVETRRGRQLGIGDVVEVDPTRYVVQSVGPATD
jgi:ribosome-associated protein